MSFWRKCVSFAVIGIGFLACAGSQGTITGPRVASVQLSTSRVDLLAGDSVDLTATVVGGDGSSLTGRALSWTTSDPGIATLGTPAADYTALVHAVGEGSAQIVVTVEGVSDTTVVSVSGGVGPVASIEVSPSAASLSPGESIILAAQVEDGAGAVLGGRTIDWSSSAPGVASVSPQGGYEASVEAVSNGDALIIATVEGLSDTTFVSVAAVMASVATVGVTPGAASLSPGDSIALVAAVEDAGGAALVGRTISWSSLVPGVATVSQRGGYGASVEAVSDGTAMIVATVEGVSDTVSVTVTTPMGQAECQTPASTWIWCDDFEQDRLSSYFEYGDDSGTFVRASSVGVQGSMGMRASFGAGDTSAGSMKLAFGSTPDRYFGSVTNGTENYREIFWRLYLKHQDGWQGGGGDKLSRASIMVDGSWSQAMVAHVWSGGQASNRDYLMIEPVSGTDGSGNVVAMGYNDFANFEWIGSVVGTTPIFDSSHVGEWYCVEAQVRLNDSGQSNGLFRMWIDDSLEAESTGLDYVASYNTYGLNVIFLENFWNNGSPVAQSRYMDNFVVSTQRIGC